MKAHAYSDTYVVRNSKGTASVRGPNVGKVEPYVTRDGLPVVGSYAELKAWGFPEEDIVLRPKNVREFVYCDDGVALA